MIGRVVGDDVDGRSVLAEERRLAVAQGDAAAQGADDLALLARERTPVGMMMMRRVVEVAADQAAEGPAEHRLGGGVGEDDDVVLAQADHRLAEMVGDGLQEGRLPAQGLVSLALGRAVAQDLEIADLGGPPRP